MVDRLLHVVATRMLCKLRPWHDASYIKQRLDIFEAFTLPSLRKQTNQNFHWLLLVNPRLEESLKKRLQQMISQSENIHIVYVDITKELHNQKEYERGFEEFLEQLPGEYDYLLSSRIDSDDCWNINYVKYLHKNVKERLSAINEPANFPGVILSFPYGVFCYPYKIRGKLGLVNCRVSYLGTSVDLLTTFSKRLPLYRFPHSKSKKFARNLGLGLAKITTAEPMWLYLQHDQNFSLTDADRWRRWFHAIEKLFFRPYPISDKNLGQFGLNTNAIQESGFPRISSHTGEHR